MLGYEGYFRKKPREMSRLLPGQFAIAQAYVRANARVKAKGGGVISEIGCEVGAAWVCPLCFAQAIARAE